MRSWMRGAREGLLPDGADPCGAELGVEGFGAGDVFERYLGYCVRAS